MHTLSNLGSRTHRLSRIFTQGLMALALGLVAATPAQAYNRLVVFGDSLSDSGNNALLLQGLPPSVISGNGSFAKIPFASGTYTNGQVWAQQLATRLGFTLAPSLAGGSNYAFGGAETSAPGTDGPGGFPFSMSTQLGMFLKHSQGQADGQSLYVIAGGGNNVRAALEAIAGGADAQATAMSLVAGYAQDMGGMVDQLQAAGAKHIVVWNTPDFGLTPLARSLGASFAQQASALSFAMNQALSLRLAGEGVQTFDVFSLLRQISAQGAASGFSNWTDACGAAVNQCDPTTSLFYDGIHPTAKGHGILADRMFVAVVPEPASFFLMLIGLSALAALSHRRRAQTGFDTGMRQS